MKDSHHAMMDLFLSRGRGGMLSVSRLVASLVSVIIITSLVISLFIAILVVVLTITARVSATNSAIIVAVVIVSVLVSSTLSMSLFNLEGRTPDGKVVGSLLQHGTLNTRSFHKIHKSEALLGVDINLLDSAKRLEKRADIGFHDVLRELTQMYSKRSGSGFGSSRRSLFSLDILLHGHSLGFRDLLNRLGTTCEETGPGGRLDLLLHHYGLRDNLLHFLRGGFLG
mmetsp:Transcript_5099/g.9665  ORF Transcript_5099/g.9665 Transcript_5099/m.9665 type:complete len:226 (-) Transcript_5099:688-1365(-)